MLANETPEGLPRGLFALSYISFFLFFSVLSKIARFAAGRRAAEAAALLPAALFIWLLRDAEGAHWLIAAVLAAAGVRAVFIFIAGREKILTGLTFVLDAAALWLCLYSGVLGGQYVTDRLLFGALSVLTLASLQKILFERGREAFPFGFFAILFALLVSLPMSCEPINWTAVIEAGQNLVDTVMGAADSAAYYLSSFFEGESYEAGYSTFGAAGEGLEASGKTEVLLRTADAPYRVYSDEETGKGMRVRRIVYLAGGRGADQAQLVRFLHFLHKNGITREEAALFSETRTIDVTYEYLSTRDEIAPAGTFLLRSGGKKVETGSSRVRHRKGYELTARFIDIDYGSPYFAALLLENETPAKTPALSYNEIAEYAQKLYSIRFSDIMDRETYAALSDESFEEEEFLAADGAAERMAALAETITGGALNDYDKCRQIEAYLRQYAYSRKAPGGHDPKSDLTTPEGMADIADRFLFETQSGYCVHYTSAMVMLLRLSGIPARAAAGYRYVFPFEREDTYEVGGNLAHAWPEAYLAGIGWVPFEPTAGVRTMAEYTWHRTAAGKAAGGTTVKVPEVPELPEAEESALPETQDEASVRTYRAAGLLLLSMAGIILAVFAGIFLAGKIRYRWASPDKRFMMDVAAIKRSIRKQSGEAFSERGLMSDYTARAPGEIREEVGRVFEVYYRVVYGGGPGVTPEECELARSLRDGSRDLRGRGPGSPRPPSAASQEPSPYFPFFT